MPLSRPEERQPRQRAGRVGDGRRKQVFEVAREALDRRPVEEVAVVLPGAGEAGGGLGQAQGEIEFGRHALRGQRGEGEARQLQGAAGRVLEDEHRLEERRPAPVPLGVERLDDLLERQVLVGEGVEGGRAHPGEQLPEGRLAGGVDPEDQGVDEEADQPLDFAAVAVGDGRADREVLFPRIAGEEGGKAGEELHEEGGPRGARRPGQSVGELAGERERADAAPRRRHKGTRAVGRQIERLEPR